MSQMWWIESRSRLWNVWCNKRNASRLLWKANTQRLNPSSLSLSLSLSLFLSFSPPFYEGANLPSVPSASAIGLVRGGGGGIFIPVIYALCARMVLLINLVHFMWFTVYSFIIPLFYAWMRCLCPLPVQ